MRTTCTAIMALTSSAALGAPTLTATPGTGGADGWNTAVWPAMTSGVRSDTVQISFLGSSPVLTITNEDSGVTRGQAFVIPMNQIDGWQTFTETLGGSNATPTGETTSEQGGQIYAGSPLMGAGPQSPQGQLLSGSLAMLPPAGTAVPLPSPATLAAIGIGGLLFGSRRRISAKSINP